MSLAAGTGAQVLAVELVEPGAAEVKFLGGCGCVELLLAMLGQNVTNERSRQTVNQLQFFIRWKMPEKNGFFALELMPAGG